VSCVRSKAINGERRAVSKEKLPGRVVLVSGGGASHCRRSKASSGDGIGEVSGALVLTTVGVAMTNVNREHLVGTNPQKNDHSDIPGISTDPWKLVTSGALL